MLMRKEALTVSEALKFSRHDFLNELQMILMYIDLGDLLKAKKTIHNATDHIRQLSILSKLGLPETEKWISTFSWIFSSFQTKISCTIKSGVRNVDDLEVASYLDGIFHEIEEILDMKSEYAAHIEVKASASDWLIQLTVSGVLNGKKPLPKAGAGFFVTETVVDNLWKLTIRGN